MRHVIISVVTALAIGAAMPAMAQDSGGQISMQVALDVATGLGIVTVSHTEFQGSQWEIEAVTASADGWRSMSTHAPGKCGT